MSAEDTPIDRERALEIARANAAQAYRDLSVYKVEATLKDDEWFVDFNLADPGMVGGGPHYVISAKSGEITAFRFEQ